ncbi:MAG: DNA-deoxyinosine glycosylase [Sulfuricurvum sp.]|uniref:DNA-deoxyinosine glycosylase n=1 Tax=Sulfuricurvum sp. TaxID=2025608 RepID=UPI0026348F84|nr:DNA-deoxyinosine glycosylase [Sulfuricurvum sp.]MDD5160389.1 DNA-deoxyinosine glycosylase [Sulfuricurvum sp.]
MKPYIHPFPPILDGHTRVLFLGSFPSIASFEQAFYYAHPRNAFWPILETIFDVHLETNEAKKAFCLEKGIGLWDVIGSCERSNSSDTNLKNCIPNDFEKLLREYPNIQVLAFTGKKSHDLFMKIYKDVKIEKVLLPSTSPAHAAMKFEEKKDIYEIFIKKYLTV